MASPSPIRVHVGCSPSAPGVARWPQDQPLDRFFEETLRRASFGSGPITAPGMTMPPGPALSPTALCAAAAERQMRAQSYCPPVQHAQWPGQDLQTSYSAGQPRQVRSTVGPQRSACSLW